MVSLKGFKLWKKMNQTEIELQNMAVGMNSTVDFTQDTHIVMLDYDIHELDAVVESIWEVQDFWNLSDAFIFRTEHGHHVFFWFDHVPYGRLRQIIDYARSVDPLYKYISRFYNHKTIRVAGKYKHKDISFVKRIEGVRQPSPDEFQLGTMKKQEHAMLTGAN